MRAVELTEVKWAYVQRHVEMRGELDLLLTAIRRPDFQEPDPRPDASATGFAPSRPSHLPG